MSPGRRRFAPSTFLCWFSMATAWTIVAAGLWKAMTGFLERPPVALGALAYWVLVSAMLASALSWVARRNADPGALPGMEALRIALLAAAVGWAFHFLFNARMVGGLDARWYGYTMIDTLAQARSGHWPVFLGQGEFQWNGAAHPIRTAPYLPNLGIALDVLTLRRLPALGVQHLTLIVSLIQAVLLCYVLLTRCEPRARWLAWVAALIWLLSPVMMGYVICLEMFMTVAALSWLPLVFYGNVRVIRRDDRTGWMALAAGLSLLWMSHAAVAAWASFVTATIQGLRLLLRDFTWQAWRRAMAGGLAFLCLTAYYFYSMAELAPANSAVSPIAAMGFLVFVLALASGLRIAAGGSRLWWGVGLGALAALWFLYPLAFNWLACLLVGIALLRAGRRWAGGAWMARMPELVVAIVLLAAMAAVRFPFSMPPLDWARGSQAADFLAQLSPALYQPVSAHAIQLTDLQLGRVLWGIVVLGCVLAWLIGAWEARLLALAAICFAPLIAPVPGVTACLMWTIPDWLYGIGTVSVWLRVLPSFSLLAVFVSFLALTSRMPRRAVARWAAGIVLVLFAAGAVRWDVRELQKFRVRASMAVNSPEQTEAFYRADTAQLYSYSYNALPQPGYILNGPADYHLESRLLRVSDLKLLPEPLLAAPTGDEIVLATTPRKHGAEWLDCSPPLSLAPGERVILKFTFFSKNYNGTLIFHGPRGFYRNYYLPAAGFYNKSFGVPPAWPKTLAFWNTLGETQQIDVTFLQAEANPSFGDFAKVRVQRYRPEDLQIQTLGLMPYRARVMAPEAVFLETPRMNVPGYRAKVDGRPVPVAISPDGLAMVRLEPGVHKVELAYRPTPKLWLALAISALGWFGVGRRSLRLLSRKRPAT